MMTFISHLRRRIISEHGRFMLKLSCLMYAVLLAVHVLACCWFAIVGIVRITCWFGLLPITVVHCLTGIVVVAYGNSKAALRKCVYAVTMLSCELAIVSN